jgi:hypothetical protein
MGENEGSDFGQTRPLALVTDKVELDVELK